MAAGKHYMMSLRIDSNNTQKTDSGVCEKKFIFRSVSASDVSTLPPFVNVELWAARLRPCMEGIFFRRPETPQNTASINIDIWGEGRQGLREQCRWEPFFADTGLQNTGTLYHLKRVRLETLSEGEGQTHRNDEHAPLCLGMTYMCAHAYLRACAQTDLQMRMCTVPVPTPNLQI